MLEFSYEGDQEFLVYCVDEFIDSFKGKDKFLLPLSDDGRIYNLRYPNTAFLSEKQNVSYYLSRYLNDLVIEVDILAPKLIRTMPTSFWLDFIELDKLGTLQFELNGINEKIQSKVNNKKSKSVIFELVKEIVLMDEYDNFYNDFGKLSITFDLSKQDSELVDKVVKSLNLLHKINYQLYRKNYLNTRK